jgi:hypothetical protein
MIQPFPMDGHYRTDVISGVGHSGVELDRAASVTYGMFRVIAGALALYYRSLGTASTLLKKGNISDRPYC